MTFPDEIQTSVWPSSRRQRGGWQVIPAASGKYQCGWARYALQRVGGIWMLSLPPSTTVEFHQGWTKGPASDLESLIDQAIQLDNRLQERRTKSQPETHHRHMPSGSALTPLQWSQEPQSSTGESQEEVLWRERPLLPQPPAHNSMDTQWPPTSGMQPGSASHSDGSWWKTFGKRYHWLRHLLLCGSIQFNSTPGVEQSAITWSQSMV